MAKFRLLLISLAAWQILLFNLERPDILSGGRNIDLASFVYVLAGMIMVGLLVMADLGKERVELIVVPVMAIYAILKTYITLHRAIPVDTMFVYISITEIAVLLITIWVARNVSVAIASFEDAVETTVLGTDKLRVLPMAEGEEQINHELFRARRFDRPVSLLYLRNTLLDGMRNSFGQQFDLEAAFRRRYLQARIAQLVEAMTYRSDIIAWHNDNLVICLPETTKENATQFAQQLHEMLKIRLNISLKMGVATFPYDALIYSDLIDAALLNPVRFFNGAAGSDEQHTPDDRDQSQGPPSKDNDIRPHDHTEHPSRESDPLATQEFGPVFRPMSIIRSLLTGPQLFPLDGMPLFSSLPTNSSTDPALWVNRLPYQSASARQLYRVIKRTIDIVLVVGSAVFWLPLMGILALAVYLESGRPILFTQQRVGLGGQNFKMYKFRSMLPNADKLLAELGVRVNARGETVDEHGNKLDKDPRVTRIGRILRKTSLDELPQLFNVLRGDMSIVGPRPTSFGIDKYTLLQTYRLSVRPGITGLWQIYGRGDTDFDKRLLWDIKYIEKISFSLDMQILIRTIFKVFQGYGAR